MDSVYCSTSGYFCSLNNSLPFSSPRPSPGPSFLPLFSSRSVSLSVWRVRVAVLHQGLAVHLDGVLEPVEQARYPCGSSPYPQLVIHKLAPFTDGVVAACCFSVALLKVRGLLVMNVSPFNAMALS